MCKMVCLMFIVFSFCVFCSFYSHPCTLPKAFTYTLSNRQRIKKAKEKGEKLLYLLLLLSALRTSTHTVKIITKMFCRKCICLLINKVTFWHRNTSIAKVQQWFAKLSRETGFTCLICILS